MLTAQSKAAKVPIRAFMIEEVHTRSPEPNPLRDDGPPELGLAKWKEMG